MYFIGMIACLIKLMHTNSSNLSPPFLILVIKLIKKLKKEIINLNLCYAILYIYCFKLILG